MPGVGCGGVVVVVCVCVGGGGQRTPFESPRPLFRRKGKGVRSVRVLFLFDVCAPHVRPVCEMRWPSSPALLVQALVLCSGGCRQVIMGLWYLGTSRLLAVSTRRQDRHLTVHPYSPCNGQALPPPPVNGAIVRLPLFLIQRP